MSTAGKKPILIVLRHSPYGSSLAKAAVDVALASAAFDQDVDLLFSGDGVLQLLPDQNSHAVGKKNIGRQLSSLPLYDINHVYVDAEAANRYQLDLAQSALKTRLLDPAAMHALMLNYDHLIGL